MRRRVFLGMAGLLPVAACAPSAPPERPVPGTAATTATTTTTSVTALDGPERVLALEAEFDARIGLYAVDTGSGATITNRADERFAFCSTFKAVAAAGVLAGNPLSHLDTVITFGEGDLMASSFVTRKRVATGMTIGELCDAAVRYSDGTAGNLLLRDLGGPAALTAYVRGLGDTATRMDRVEPDITSAVPGDPRDTSTPRALGETFRRITLGNALPSDKRAFLLDLLTRNTTGGERVRAGVPAGWRVADKTGTGDYATINDLAVVWPPGGAPLLVAVMSSRAGADADYDEALIAATAAWAVAALTTPS